MEVEILFKETIKPSSSTPKHLKNYKFSLLDQLAPPIYIPIILFYSSTPEISISEKSDHLKKSLSETLTLFYPLAGRIKDIYSIDCNDEGASYTEARVAGEMSLILHDPQVDLLKKLLPFNSEEMTSDDVILGAQVNHFDCGGIAISVCISHQIVDASTAASFVASWAAVASSTTMSTNIEGTIYDCTSIFPPRDTQSFSWNNSFANKDRMSMTKRFLFYGSELSTLREKVENGCFSCRPSRVEIVAAVISGAIMDLSGEEYETTTTNVNNNVGISFIVGLRKRMIPPLPQLSLGNIYQATTTLIENNCLKSEKRIDYYNNLIEKIHESIEIITDDYVRKIHEGGTYFESVKDFATNPNQTMKDFGFSSWCRFPFYEVDFGWGKPIWITTTLKFNKTAILIDTKDGEGIEAWVTLPKEDMTKFQNDSNIRSYASLNTTT